jgi:thiol-disulfide isomerase/thioredoxin
MSRSALFAAVVILSITRVPGIGAVQSQDKEQQYAAQMQKGDAALQAGQVRDAIDAYKKANELHGKQSVPALFGISRAYFAMRAYQESVDTCTEALKFTGPDKRLEGQMHYMRGLAEMALGVQKSTDSELKSAEADFRATVELTDTIAIANYNLGVVLLKENKDADGVRALQAYVDRGLKSPERDEALKMIADPKRARLTIAPDFAVPTLQGERISLKGYRGQVVLLDFWGTWCGPCREFTPTMVEINQRLAGQPFVMISVAVAEQSEKGWKDYIAQKKMTWPQYLDTSKQIARLYDVHEFPTYILVDHEGILRDRKIGYGPDNASWLTYQLKQWVDAAKAAKGVGLPGMFTPAHSR